MKQPAALNSGQGPSPFAARRRADSRLPALALLLLLAQALLACSLLAGNDQPPPDEAAVLPAGPSLTCSQECSDRGQCGQSVDRGTVVLLSAGQPGVAPADFDLAVPDGAAVSVLEARSVSLLENNTGNQMAVDFYRVLVQERGVEGWVAAWCIFNPGF